MAYMKKMRKTKMRSKKNARKTKRIRGGSASKPSPYQSFLQKRAEETKNSDRLASRKLNADYITVVEKAIVKLKKDISFLESDITEKEKKSELTEKEKKELEKGKKDLSYFITDLERRNEQLHKLKEMAESRLMQNENQRR